MPLSTNWCLPALHGSFPACLFICWSVSFVDYGVCVCLRKTVFYEDESIAGTVTLFCCHYKVIEFSEVFFFFAYKIQFYPVIYHSSSTLSCLSLCSLTLFLVSSHSLMWVVSGAPPRMSVVLVSSVSLTPSTRLVHSYTRCLLSFNFYFFPPLPV